MKRLTFDEPINFTATASNQMMLPADRRRVFCEVINTDQTNTASISFGTNPAVAGKGTILMPKGGTVTLTPEYMNCRQQINVIATGNSVLAISIGR